MNGKKSIPEREKASYVAAFLGHGRKREAAKIIWPQLIQNAWTDRIWDALEAHPYLAIMGHGSASKTFTCCAYFLMDWWSRMDKTALLFTSDTIASMRRRIWADMIHLHQNTSVRMPGTVIDSRYMIQHSPLDGKHAIAGIAAESDDSQSKVQGVHAPFVRVIFDEADNKHSRSIWGALTNLGTSGDIRVVALANPLDLYSDFGQHVEPKDGWNSVNADLDTEWQSRLGWHVLRLDGLKSPNIVAGHDIFPFLLTNKSVKESREMKGTESREWWTYIRAWYPPAGTVKNIFTSEVLAPTRNPITWHSEIVPVAACDPAFEGGDDCVVSIGSMGKLASDIKKTALDVRQFIVIKRMDTAKDVMIDFGDQIISLLKSAGVKPQHFAIDATGTGMGIAQYIRHAWSHEVLSVNFGGSPTEMKTTNEDQSSAVDRFDRFVSELWFVAREWCQRGHVHFQNPPHALISQLESRIYDLMPKGKIKVETKRDMKERGLASPDYGDAFCLLVHLARVRAHEIAAVFRDGIPRKNSLAAFKRNASTFRAVYGVTESDDR